MPVLGVVAGSDAAHVAHDYIGSDDDGRGAVAAAAARGVPGHVGAGHVAFAAGPHRVKVASQSIHDKEHIAGRRDRRLAAAIEPFAEPEFAAGGRIITLDALVAVEDDLAPLASINKNRRAPAAVVTALGPPDLAARVFVESDEVAVDVGIAILDDHAIDQNRTGGRTPGLVIAGEFAEVAGPEWL